ncbi:ABC transporter permease [Marinicella litoralis]|nr:ABC transporter permease subunit [Marinicella litoralis]
MNITKKDIGSLWRSPLLWVVLSLIAFIAAWLLWQRLDRYIGLQASFATLPSPPNITHALWVPFILTLAKLLLLIIAMTTAKAFAEERAHKTLWYLLINKQTYYHVVWAKFKAQWMILLFVWGQLSVAAFLLATGGELNWTQSLVGLFGISLFTLWFVSLGMLISSFCQSTGTAVLLSSVVFVLLWVIGGESVGQEFGLNWLHLISPVQHLKWFCQGEISLSSLFYFIGGGIVLLLLTAQNLEGLRKS